MTTFAIQAELVSSTSYARTGVTETTTTTADFSSLTLALGGRTVSVKARSLTTELSFGTLGGTVFGTAESIGGTVLTDFTLTSTCGQTITSIALSFTGTCGVVVDLSITVVINTITCIDRLWLAGCTSAPVTLDTSLCTLSTLGGTFFGEAFVDTTVTVIVFTVTGLNAHTGCRTIDPLTKFTSLCTCPAVVSARTSQIVIDFTVTVIVNLVTDLFGGLFVGRTLCELSVFTGTCTCTTCRDTDLIEVIHDAIAVVVFVITDLFRSTVCDRSQRLGQIGEVIRLVVFLGTASNRHVAKLCFVYP